MTSNVFDIQFDPQGHLLARSSTELQLPEGKDFVYGPNPFETHLILKFRNHTGNETLSIYNLEGKLMKEVRIMTNPFELDLAGMNDETYVMTFGGSSNITGAPKIVKISPGR